MLQDVLVDTPARILRGLQGATAAEVRPCAACVERECFEPIGVPVVEQQQNGMPAPPNALHTPRPAPPLSVPTLHQQGPAESACVDVTCNAQTTCQPIPGLPDLGGCVLVAGASSPVGRATVARLLAAGLHVRALVDDLESAQR